jgi:hypothetical protein
MKHTLEELLNIVYQYYPREIGSADDLEARARDGTEAHDRLVAARQRAATDERWRAMRNRISERFPEAPLVNYSLHLPTGEHDACYSFTLLLPKATDSRALWFHVSFLAPYYVTHSWYMGEIAKRQGDFRVVFHGLIFFLRRDLLGPGLVLNPEELLSESTTMKGARVSFDLSSDELPYAQWIAREIETTFGCEPMPPEVGTLPVPDVSVTQRGLGKARLYDCLFTDQHDWVNSALPEGATPYMDIDPKHMTSQFIAVLTVLSAFCHILWTLTPERGFKVVQTEGTLSKEDALKILAWMRPSVASSVDVRAKAAAGEFEALVAAWGEESAPPEAMVAWASKLLSDWDAGEGSVKQVDPGRQ